MERGCTRLGQPSSASFVSSPCASHFSPVACRTIASSPATTAAATTTRWCRSARCAASWSPRPGADRQPLVSHTNMSGANEGGSRRLHSQTLEWEAPPPVCATGNRLEWMQLTHFQIIRHAFATKAVAPPLTTNSPPTHMLMTPPPMCRPACLPRTPSVLSALSPPFSLSKRSSKKIETLKNEFFLLFGRWTGFVYHEQPVDSGGNGIPFDIPLIDKNRPSGNL